MKSNFFKNKKILITGHTGFKGAWLSYYLYLLSNQDLQRRRPILQKTRLKINFSPIPRKHCYFKKDKTSLNKLTND